MTTAPIIPIADFFAELSTRDPALTMRLAGGLRLNPHADATSLCFLLINEKFQSSFMGWTGQIFTASYDPKNDKAELRGYHFTPRNEHPSSHFEMQTLTLVYNGHAFKITKTPGTTDLYSITNTIKSHTGDERKWMAERYQEAFKLAKNMKGYHALLHAK